MHKLGLGLQGVQTEEVRDDGKLSQVRLIAINDDFVEARAFPKDS